MLEDEYEANKQVIKDFLASACFWDSELGTEKDISKGDWFTLHIQNKYVHMSLRVPDGVMIEKEIFSDSPDFESGGYWLYLDKEKKNSIYISTNAGKGELERTGDNCYYLNTDDFEQTVYEIVGSRGGCSYFFLNHFVELSPKIQEEDNELLEYAKEIVKSVRFE